MNKDAATYSGSDTVRESLQHKAERIIRDAIDEHDLLVDPSQIHVFIVDHLQRRRGDCHFDTKTPNGDESKGDYAIRIDRRIDGFEGTVLHELAHAELYEAYEYTGHGKEFHELNETLGGTAGGDNHAEYKYYMTCVNCKWVLGRFRYCKKIHSANTYVCNNCGGRCSSYQAGDDEPTEAEVVAERL